AVLMARIRDESFKEYVLDQLAAMPGVRSRVIFGGNRLYQGGRLFGILMEGRLYFKTNAKSRPDYVKRGMSPFIYKKGRQIVSLNYFEVPPDVLENRDALVAWAERAIQLRAAKK